MNTLDNIVDALEDLQSFIRDYLNTVNENPDYSDVPRLIRMLDQIKQRIG
jgi:hypothetical protein